MSKNVFSGVMPALMTPCKADRTPEQARMRLHKRPVQPTWTPRYAAHELRIESWSKFVSEAYWNVPLEG